MKRQFGVSEEMLGCLVVSVWSLVVYASALFIKRAFALSSTTALLVSGFGSTFLWFVLLFAIMFLHNRKHP